MIDGHSLGDTGIPIIKGYKPDGNLTMLSTTDNVNTLFENGVYGTEANTRLLPGAPAANPGILTIYAFNDGTDVYLTQTWYDNTTNELHTRQAKKALADNTAPWESWEKMINKGDIIGDTASETVHNSEQLNGHSTYIFQRILHIDMMSDYLGKTAKASDSDKLDGKHLGPGGIPYYQGFNTNGKVVRKSLLYLI